MQYLITTNLLIPDPQDNVVNDLWGLDTKDKLVPCMLRYLRRKEIKSDVILNVIDRRIDSLL